MITPTQPAAGRLATMLGTGRFAITAEIVPPVSCNREDLVAKAMPLKGLADAVNVTDASSARAHLGALAAAAILRDSGIEPILQIACRDRNRIALQGDLLGAAALGITNLLLLRGDDPAAGDQPDAKPVFDLDSRALLETARLIRDRGELPSGRKVSGRASFLLGAADIPVDPPSGWEPTALKAKIAAGAEFVQTQFCMDTTVARRYLQRLADTGVLERVHVLVGVAPLRSGRSAQWMSDHLPGTIIPATLISRLDRAIDPATEGLRACIEVVTELADIPGVAGVHIMAPGNERAIPEVIASVAGIARRQSAV